MKKILMTILIAAFCFGCGGGSGSGDEKPVSTNEENKNSQIGGEAAGSGTTAAASADTTKAPATAAAPAKDGKALIEGSDCRTCHHDNDKLIGPAYAEVAKKYEATDANIKKLAEKVLKGGQGVWGEIPMAGHPTLAEEDAEAMVKYILSMKK